VTYICVLIVIISCLNSVNLLLSPQNPLSTKLLERTAAVHTVVFLINNLFLDVNDIISFKWYPNVVELVELLKI
jgi:hypothetical protein